LDQCHGIVVGAIHAIKNQQFFLQKGHRNRISKELVFLIK
jgi:hypothetical protein